MAAMALSISVAITAFAQTKATLGTKRHSSYWPKYSGDHSRCA